MKKESLHNIKESGFKVPKDYFNTVEDHIMSEIKLKAHGTDSPFTLPPNYFDILEDNILSTVSEKKSPKVITLFSKKNMIYISGIAAAILLIFFNGFLFEKKLTLDQFDSETVANYILNENFESYEIADLLDEEDLTEENFSELQINEQDIETYILDHLEIDDLY